MKLSPDEKYQFEKLIVKKNRKKSDIENFASRLNCHPTTIYRWIKRYDKNNREIEFFHHKKGRYESRLDPDVDRLIREEIAHFPKKHQSIRKVHLAVTKRIKTINLRLATQFSIPSYVTIRNRFIKSRNL